MLREILFANRDIDELLADSDKTMSLVEDLFGENPGKYAGISTVTPAPNYYTQPNRDEMYANSLSSAYSGESDGSETPDRESNLTSGSNFQDGLNLEHYKSLLRSTENELRMLNNGMLRAASANNNTKPESRVQSDLRDTPRSLMSQFSSAMMSNRSDQPSLPSGSVYGGNNDLPPSTGGDMRLILSAIQDLKSAVMTNSMSQNQTQSTISASNGPQSDRGQNMSPEEQLSNLRNLQPLVQKANEKKAQSPHGIEEQQISSTDVNQNSLHASLKSGGINFSNLKTFDQLVNAIRSLYDEQNSLNRKLEERDLYVKKLEAQIEKQNATIRALAEDIIQLQGVMTHWAEVQNHS